MRMRSRWFKQDKQRSLPEIAGVLGFISWQIAVERVKNMERWQYNVNEPERTLAVLSEYLIFLAHVTDRILFESFTFDQRTEFITALVKKIADTLDDNRADIGTVDKTRQDFIDYLNQRFDEYSEYEFYESSAEPSYSMYRFFGQNISKSMGQDNDKGVAEQIIEIEGPLALETLKKAIDKVVS